MYTGLITVFLIIMCISMIVAIVWAKGISEMDKKYPNYKGKDFFNEEENNS